MTLRDLVNKYGGTGTIQEKIAAALSSIFDFSFPMYADSYKTVLETKIVNHYLRYELCEYEEDEWKFDLYQWLNEFMPAFNRRYDTTLIQIKPLINHWLESTKSGTGAHATQETSSATITHNTHTTTETENETQQGHGLTTQSEQSQSSTSTSNGTAHKTHKGSDAPNGPIDSIEDGYITEGAIDDETNTQNGGQSQVGNGKTIETGQQTGNEAGKVDTTQSGGQTTSGTAGTQYSSTEQWLETVAGNVGISQSKLLQEYRDILIDIDREIIEAMAPLFVMVYR